MRALVAAALIVSPAFAGDTVMHLTPSWEYVADTVMGGKSQGQGRVEEVAGRDAMHLTGEVSLDNNGGFIQIAFDVEAETSQTSGLRFHAYGNGETYEVRLRTSALDKPWQSFRATFDAPAEWTEITLPFADFEANKTDATFAADELERIGFLAYGKEFEADLAITDVQLLK